MFSIPNALIFLVWMVELGYLRLNHDDFDRN